MRRGDIQETADPGDTDVSGGRAVSGPGEKYLLRRADCQP